MSFLSWSPEAEAEAASNALIGHYHQAPYCRLHTARPPEYRFSLAPPVCFPRTLARLVSPLIRTSWGEL